MLTPKQICILIAFTELITYSLLSKGLDTIKSCSISKTYRKGLEKGLISSNEFESIMIKEEKKDGNE